MEEPSYFTSVIWLTHSCQSTRADTPPDKAAEVISEPL